MKKLNEILTNAGLESINDFTYKSKNKINKSESIKYTLNKDIDFYLSKKTLDFLSKINLPATSYEESIFLIPTNVSETDLYYSSKIEGIDFKVDKDKYADSKFKWKNAYSEIITYDFLSHETLQSITEDLLTDKQSFEESMREKDSLYRKKRVGIYSWTKNLQQELIHEGLDSKVIKESMNIVFDLLNKPKNTPWEIIVDVSISHMLFEYVHPYYDGNGRMGRLLMFWGIQKSKNKELGYSLSEIISNNKNKYYKSLQYSQKTLNLDYFVLFMAEAMIESSIVNRVMESIIEDYELTRIQFFFIRRLLHLGMLEGGINYPKIKGYLNDMTRQAFFKSISKLVSMGLIEVDESKKTHTYKLNSDYSIQ